MGSGPERRLVDDLFTAALELPAADRKRFVAEQCRGNPELEASVYGLLEAATGPDPLLDGPMADARRALLSSLGRADHEEDLSGQSFGLWRLQKPIARGGLATVYRATRVDGEFDQTVAFKVLRRGLDTDDLIARFQVERQILSALDHPAIVQILDGGALEDGRPYLVLEYVDGVAITDYANSENLAVSQRLQLVSQVLEALQHAHQHLVVHRDIKPSNILVTGEGNVALLDFGIAKLLDASPVGGASPRTRTGMALLTPGYASPEQRNAGPVTTASDIYQVGMLLYELLAGERPADSTDNLPPPSKVNPRRRSELRGDLDAIVRQAMHPDPGRRYATASELRLDLMRSLSGQPVSARADTWLYRFSKLRSRRPWLLPGVTLAVLMMGTYLVTITRYNLQLERETKRAAAVLEFVVDLFESADPYLSSDPERGRDITLLNALDLGQERLRGAFDAQPRTRAELLNTLSRTYRSIGQHDVAIDLREQALAIEQAEFGPTSAAVAASQRFLALQLDEVGDDQRAGPLYEQQLELTRELYPADAPEVGVAEAAMATWLWHQGEVNEALSMAEAGIQKMQRDPQEFAGDLINAVILRSSRTPGGTTDQYVNTLQQTLALADEVYGDDSVMRAVVQGQLAAAQSMSADTTAALGNYIEALEIHERRLGPLHNATLSLMNNIAVAYLRFDRPADSEAMHRNILERQLEVHGEDHLELAGVHQNLATAISRQDRFDEALPLHQRAYELYRRYLNDNHYNIALPLLSMSYGRLHRDQPDVALAYAREARERLSRALPGSVVEGIALCLEARSLEALGQSYTQLLTQALSQLGDAEKIRPYDRFCGSDVARGSL
ncbi:MAG: serine/threonine-protein kinase [Pseudomonadota bacterium]